MQHPGAWSDQSQDGAWAATRGAQTGWPERMWARRALLAITLLGALVFAWRGPVRAVVWGSGDFALIYAGARVWLQGGNPYDIECVSRVWDRDLAPAQANLWHVRQRGPVLLYPPAMSAFAAPLALLPWRVAAGVWAAMNVVACVLAVWCAARLAGLSGWRAAALWAAAVWFMAFGTNVGYGQTGALAAGGLAAGMLLRHRGHHALGGALLGIVTVLKPQAGLLFVVYEAGRLRWRAVLAAIVAGSGLMALGASRLVAAGVPWLASWREQIQRFTVEGDASPLLTNIVRQQMVNLHVPLHVLTDDRTLVHAVVFGTLAVLSGAYFLADLRRGRQQGDQPGELLSLSMTAVVTLLIVYHRTYDMVLLIFPLALAVSWLTETGSGDGTDVRFLPRRRQASVMLALLAPLIVSPAPLLSLVHLKMLRQEPAPALVEHWAWNVLVMAHQTWLLLALGVWLVWVRAAVGPGSDRGRVSVASDA